MKKISKIILWVLMLIGIVFTILYFLNKGEEGSATLDSWTGIYISWAYVSLALAVVLVILMPLLTIKERKINFKSLIVLVIIVAAVVGVSYALAPGTPVTLANSQVYSGMTTKLTDTGIIVCYILLAASVLAILGGSVYSSIRKD